MRDMDLVADFFPPSNGLSDAAARAKLEALRAALDSGDVSALDDRQQAFAERIAQATQKIGSGTEIKRVSELMTLAQFGPASIGAAVAQACDDEPSQPVAEALFVARFLVEVVFAAARAPALLPDDLLKKHQLDREQVSWPAAAPVYLALLTRAAETINRAETAGIVIASPALRKMLARHRMQTSRQITRLHNRDPASPGTRLTGFDNVVISIKLLLRLRGAS
ncbi:MAG: hypothetical protein ACI9JL_002245 [Paracoccaceae bacterium]|jgi:hypothetical protein